MKLTPIDGNYQRLDGGAMFGNAPKAVWSKWVSADDNNSIDLATRGLMVEFDDDTRVLFETGVGAFFPPELRHRYGVLEDKHVLLENLAVHQLTDADIDAVVLSHLHFDHAGGLLSAWQENESSTLLFPNAKFLVSRTHWERAINPHPRDRASFIPELNTLLQASGRLELIEPNQTQALDGKIKLHHSDGHTPGLMLSEITCDKGPVVFCADLIPGSPWVHLPITMGYDRFPEQVINEKQQLLDDLYDRQGYLFFTHDPNMQCGLIERDAKGRYSVTAIEI